MSRFPGMDPFIESQLWEDFHTLFIAAIRTWLMPRLSERYYAQAEARVYIEHQCESALEHYREPQPIVADVAVVPTPGQKLTSHPQPAQAPFLVPVAMPREVTQRFLTIRLRDTREVVTVIEVLSPANKRSGSDGRREYVSKRDHILRSGSHLVEVDLLRGGERPPMAEPLPPADYYVILSRVSRRPMAEVWAWRMWETLPTISVPLSGPDADVALELQAVLADLFERAQYERMLDYSQKLKPVPGVEEEAWVSSRLAT